MKNKSVKKKPVKKKAVKNKGGRPEKPLDYKLIDNLCAIQCTGEEVASALNVSYETLNRRIKKKVKIGFKEYFEQKARKGRISLRRKQYQMALSGDRVMLIWLGKQYLKQAEKQETINKNFDYDLSQLPEEELNKFIKQYGNS